MMQMLYTQPLLFEAGDRMDREEFLARWEEMPDLKRAELIDGVVYLPSPVSRQHSGKEILLSFWVATYASRVAKVEALSNATWMMEAKSAPQPDVALRIRPEFGGQSRNVDIYAGGAPELAAEVARSTRSYDLGPKLKLYERAGVREYLAALIEEQRLEWRVLREGRYELLPPGPAGVYRSTIFPGLWLDEAAFWANDSAAVLRVLEQGMSSPEFAAFSLG
ncbi:MAG TPA: Uma2 family endonuclease [Bryobacteraceae bacterium]|nr:Uma2 family endonuclease [Bryobacteraceae bacterium]